MRPTELYHLESLEHFIDPVTGALYYDKASPDYHGYSLDLDAGVDFDTREVKSLINKDREISEEDRETLIRIFPEYVEEKPDKKFMIYYSDHDEAEVRSDEFFNKDNGFEGVDLHLLGDLLIGETHHIDNLTQQIFITRVQ